MVDDNNKSSFCQRKPEISYPCSWEYKVIGENQEKLKEVILQACEPVKPVIVLSNRSSSGKYVSLNATLTVDSEQRRLEIFDRIHKSPAVKMVI